MVLVTASNFHVDIKTLFTVFLIDEFSQRVYTRAVGLHKGGSNTSLQLVS